MKNSKKAIFSLETKGTQLNDNDLSKVNGGTVGGTETRSMYGCEFSGHVNKYSGIVGHYYYATDDNSRTDWIYGKLLYSDEKPYGPCATKRVHVIDVERCGGNCQKGTKEILGDSWTLYTTRTTFF